jgi:hypothetical protein
MEAIKVLLVLSLLPISSAVAGMWSWFCFWIALIALIGIVEGVCVMNTGKTLSQHFWTEKQNKKKFMIIAIVVVCVCLIGHLCWRW